MIYLDIETAADPEAIKRLPPFDPNKVKLGNTKDPDKVAERIREAEENYISEAKAKAPLDPFTGQVVAVTIGDYMPCVKTKEPPRVRCKVLGKHFDSEKDLLVDMVDTLYSLWDNGREVSRHMTLFGFRGWNIAGFDLPFLTVRMLKHRVPIPWKWQEKWGLDGQCVDYMKLLSCGDRNRWVSLDKAAQFFLSEEKEGSGADIPALWEAKKYGEVKAYAVKEMKLLCRLSDYIPSA